DAATAATEGDETRVVCEVARHRTVHDHQRAAVEKDATAEGEITGRDVSRDRAAGDRDIAVGVDTATDSSRPADDVVGNRGVLDHGGAVHFDPACGVGEIEARAYVPHDPAIGHPQGSLHEHAASAIVGHGAPDQTNPGARHTGAAIEAEVVGDRA